MDGVVLHVSTDLAGVVRTALIAEETAATDGFVQRLHPTVRLLGIIALLVAAALSTDFAVLVGLAALAAALAVAARLPPRPFLARTLAVAAFSGVVVLPQLVLAPGPTLVSVAGVAVTRPGLAYVALFETRVVASVALVTVLSMTTPFGTLVATLRSLGAPATPTTLFALTYRYLFLCFDELHRALLARESRQLRPRGLLDEWRELGALAGSFLLRTVERGERVERGMRARGGARPATPYRRPSPLGFRDALFAAVALGALGLVVLP
ncbi:cobalt ECF transporter T component CbiQ [Salinigranum halophilum]|uniref:cobalt ECF transporter T component CbiQ n=1 Tax=Salinigranum halophilum TaxID=2565931 RepID=UPI0010A8F486|nr:cobalt ECF transporter T component CbiQ [Salinigranum halophilum]